MAVSALLLWACAGPPAPPPTPPLPSAPSLASPGGRAPGAQEPCDHAESGRLTPTWERRARDGRVVLSSPPLPERVRGAVLDVEVEAKQAGRVVVRVVPEAPPPGADKPWWDLPFDLQPGTAVLTVDLERVVDANTLVQGGRAHHLELSAAPEVAKGLRPLAILIPPSACQPSPWVETAPPKPAPDVIVVLIDTLAADAVGAWGGSARTPEIDRFVAENLSFFNAYAGSSWTKPSVATLLTGMPALVHGVGTRSYTDTLPTEVETLPGFFRSGGWRAGLFSENPLAGALSGLERDYDLTEGGAEPTLLAWMAEDPRPVFAWLQWMDVHDHRGRYDEAVARADARFGRLRAALEAAGRWEGAVVVLLSDHGESRGGGGRLGHGTGLPVEQLHVPLSLKIPGGPTGRREDLVSLVDLAATLSDLFEGRPLPGRSWFGRSGDAVVFAERTWFIDAPDAPLTTIFDGTLRLERGPAGLRLLRGEVDQEGSSGTLASMLAAWERDVSQAALPRATPRPLEAEERRALEALGYLDPP